jgi:regulator of RNase E activity RraA
VATNEPVTIGDVVVSFGDYVVADGSAVAFVSPNDILQVLDTAESIVEREKAMANALHQGEPISKVMGTNYEQMLKR